MTDISQSALNSKDNDFEELLKESFSKSLSEESIVEGTVRKIHNGYAVVDVGLKSEGVIDFKELALDESDEAVKVGDKIKVFIESFEGRDGSLKLSRERVLQEETWEDIKNKYENSEVVKGEIIGRVKGGFIVKIKYLTAFLPGSQLDVRPVKDIDVLLGHDESFKILKMDELRGNVVVSRRAILEEGHQEAVDKVLATISEGQVMDGVIKNITNYGAFIDLGTIDGLIHIADISWSRISHPSEVLTIGQKVKVKVIKFDMAKKQVSLGIKQLEHDPWADMEDKLESNSKFKGRITNITDYGVFVEIQKGIEGLVHVSEMTWAKSNSNPIKDVVPGQEVEVVILEVDKDKHRISLSMKRCTENPWKNFIDNNKVGDVIKGNIRSFADFGIFVGFKDNIDGLVHFSDVTWDGDAKKAIAEYKKGDEIEVKILDVDLEKERLSLGIKQLADDPFDNISDLIGDSKRVTCVVKKIQADGITVSIADSVDVFIKKLDLSRDKSEQRPDRFAVGEKVDANVVKLDKENRKVILSIKALEIQEEKQVIKDYGSTNSGASLGDILGNSLDDAIIGDKK